MGEIDKGLRDLKDNFLALNNARPGDQNKRPVPAENNIPDYDFFDFHHGFLSTPRIFHQSPDPLQIFRGVDGG